MNCLLSNKFRLVYQNTHMQSIKFTPTRLKLQVLHRLDHSVHTMRLWANTKAKELCSEWNMNMFFRLIHNDMNGICLVRLNEVRAPGEEFYFISIFLYNFFLLIKCAFSTHKCSICFSLHMYFSIVNTLCVCEIQTSFLHETLTYPTEC